MILIGIIIVIGLILSYIYLSYTETYYSQDFIDKSKKTQLKQEQKTEEKKESKTDFSIDDSGLEEKILKFIRNFYEIKYNVQTTNMSFNELLAIEQDKKKRENLEKIFKLLNKKLYGGQDIDREELLEEFRELEIV